MDNPELEEGDPESTRQKKKEVSWAQNLVRRGRRWRVGCRPGVQSASPQPSPHAHSGTQNSHPLWGS